MISPNATTTASSLQFLNMDSSSRGSLLRFSMKTNAIRDSTATATAVMQMLPYPGAVERSIAIMRHTIARNRAADPG